MRLFVIALFFAGLCMAVTVRPDYIEIKDTGQESLPKLDVGLAVDCVSKDLNVLVSSNATGEPVANASTYLFYTDYTYQALPNPSKTGTDGSAIMPVPGNIRFLTALFVLRVDRQGFRSREIEFTYQKCFEEEQAPPPPPPTPEPIMEEPEEEAPPAPPPVEEAPEVENQSEQPAPAEEPVAPEEPGQQIPCLPAFLLPLLLIRR